MKPELVVMAAGMGSRFGGLKQMEPVGPGGERVMDYALFDARRAGVERVVFVIRKAFAEEFRRQVGDRYASWLEVAYAFQELDQLPSGAILPEGRAKPWGTAHAILAARAQVRGPFMAINADDFYGRHAFEAMVRFLADPARDAAGAYAMVAFRLANTLSEHGTVARGVCRVGAGGDLLAVAEHTALEPDGSGARELAANGSLRRFTGQERVSMNFWGFRPDVFGRFEALFRDFLAAHGADPRAEFYIPTAVDALIRQDLARVAVLDTPDRWFGVTYREDKAAVEARIRELIQAGAYPPALWSR